jgi:hypothetical protein
MTVDFTPEEEAMTKGMPLNVAIGFIASRRGVDVRESQSKYQVLKDRLRDLQDKGEVTEDQIREGLQRFSDQWSSREQPQS